MENAPPPVIDLNKNYYNLFEEKVNNYSYIPDMKKYIRDYLNINKTKLAIKYKELKELKSEYLIELIQFISCVCNLTVENKYIDCLYSIFKIVKYKGQNIYQIVINKKEANRHDYKKKINDMNNEIIDDEEENEDNILNENDDIFQFGTFFCEKHNRLFNNLEQYYNHCSNYDEKLICEKCLKGYRSINKFKNHKCNIIKNKDKEEIDKNEDSDSYSDSNKVECSECDLVFDSIESMSLHYFEIHEKKKQKI